ncbi:MAG: hypothetical protein AABO58_06825 [Acidobacteriota bacterium]
MTDGTRILRTLAVPLIVALVFLFLVPKTCQKAIGTRKLRLPTAAASPPSDTGLHIESVSPDAPSSRPVSYPAGLDAQRVRYLIEIDPHFVEPYKILLPKPGGMVVDPAPADALVRAGWFESSGGGYTPARGAALHLGGMNETPVAWLVPAGKRKFERVTSTADLGNGKARVGFTWQWEPNEAGRAIKSSFDLHQGAAEFGGGGEHPWDLNSVSVDGEWR